METLIQFLSGGGAAAIAATTGSEPGGSDTAGFFMWLITTYPNLAPLVFLVIGVSFLCSAIATRMPAIGQGGPITKSPVYAVFYRVINTIALNLKWARNSGDPKMQQLLDTAETTLVGSVTHRLADQHVADNAKAPVESEPNSSKKEPPP